MRSSDGASSAKNERQKTSNNYECRGTFSALRKLKRADKLRAIQLLVEDLAVEEEALFLPGAPYEVWSPLMSYGTFLRYSYSASTATFVGASTQSSRRSSVNGRITLP